MATEGYRKFKKNIPHWVTEKVLDWNRIHGVDTVQGLNRRVKDGSFPELIKAEEERYHDEVAKAAALIAEHLDRIRIVIVAGPSSSGKTTTTTKISEKLQKLGYRFKLLNLDNYFWDLELHPKDEFGDYDFETPQALDLKLINQHLGELLEGKTVQSPCYNFKTGLREEETVPFNLEENEILLLDCLHGLYQEMTDSITDSKKFRLYIETLSMMRGIDNRWIRWTDIRLLRRMVRDIWHRSYSPVATIGHWHYVRKSEMKHIVPFITKVDYVFNGALSYELPIHKKYMFKYVIEAMDKFRDMPKKKDAYRRAERVFNLLNSIEVCADDSIVPKDSLLREFIGGSSYEYKI